MSRVLVISLDGYESGIANAMMASGQLPALAQVRETSARFVLDHGTALRTGLGAEHLASGLSPNDANRWSSLHFDPASYRILQKGPQFSPFASHIKSKTVVFDLPYFDLLRAPNVRGISAWGAHDAGTEHSTNPADLVHELFETYGPYPATDSIYAFSWPSPSRSQAVATELVHGVDLRSRVAVWLLKEKFPDWDLALIGVSEAHSALEALWHGYDPQHPLHSLPSSAAAGDGIRNVYKAIDRLVGTLASEFGDATRVVFSMHGMGPNRSDVASMVLLPELLYRHAFGEPFFQPPAKWANAAGGVPILGESEAWDVSLPTDQSLSRAVRSRLRPWIPAGVRESLKRLLREPPNDAETERSRSLEWMPASRYQPFWSTMPAFALPSYYDGRIRINLKGRERDGIVPLDQYQACCEQIEQLLKECRNPISGEPVVDSFERHHASKPLAVDSTDADITVVWSGAALAIEHPTLGKIGPVPFRRTGGHTEPFGVAFVSGDRIDAGDRGRRSSFDVVPTLFDLLGEPSPGNISGRSLLASDSNPSR